MVFFNFIQILIEHSGDPDQMQHFAEFDRGLLCLPVSLKKDPRHI